ncbi:CRTAC1 family protein [Rhodovulum sp. DZ06]|uniref:CRTAC1 family protein n=1 Tax=Rhodovulum sp. DZ06 TaxID=3425126 RepID=UPI003D334783
MRRKALALAAALTAALAAGTAAAGAPRFVPVPVPSHVYDGGWEHFVGGGVAAFDCDGDARPELYAAGGTTPATLLRNIPGPGLRFEADTPPALALTGVTGAYPLDVDGDGRLDLAILRVGPDILLRGLPDCGFEPFPGALGFTSGDHWTTAFSATWEGEAARPTLAFGTYVDRADPKGPFEACDAPLLYRPEGGAYGPPITLAPGYCALSLLFSDWSRSGRADLRVSNDRHYYVRGGQEQMWAMEAAPRLYTEEEGWAEYALWGMGIASRDLDQDGFPELYLTSMGDQKLQLFDGDPARPHWREARWERGATAHRPHAGGDGRPSTGWHAAFGDVDNDGLDDIFVAKGNVEQMPDAAMEDPNSLLLQRPDGTFAEASVAAGVASMARGRGAALVDLDNDGRLDLAVVNRRAPMEVWRNVTEGGGWLLVEASQPGPNPDAVGAVIEVKAAGRLHTREITVGGGHAGGHAGFQHFGLGDAKAAQLRITWPGGETTAWQEARPNAVLRLSRTR